MILAFDTYYYENKAKTVCIAFEDWASGAGTQIFTEVLEGIEEYVPGEFYRRELPCILSLLKQIDLKAVETIIVDGFVYLDDANRPGLGAHLYQQLNAGIPVVGVAKTNFASIETNKRAVLRGQSTRPLYVTAVGTDPDLAAEKVRMMSGPNRIPDLLKQLDQLTKETEVPHG